MNSVNSAPLRVAVIGTGGCAVSHHRALLQLEQLGRCTLVATCDPAAGHQARPAWVKEGAPIFSCYREMLGAISGKADYVVVPTPIHLHAEMHREVVAAGFACYLEKPPTLDPGEFETMLVNERSARVASCVGFGFLFRPELWALKERIVRGEFGRVRHIGFLGFAPKAKSYFTRNAWAGKVRWGERLLLDSCMGNGMSHHLHTTLFWSGTGDLWSWSRPRAVRASLFRANAIETPDTVFAEAITDTGVRLRFAMTNACARSYREERIQCEQASIRIVYGRELLIAVRREDGRIEEQILPARDAYVESHLWYQDCIRGRRPRPFTLLSDCVGMLHLNALAYISSGGIAPVAPTLTESGGPPGDPRVCIVGIEALAEHFLRDGVFPALTLEPPAQEPYWAEEEHLPLLHSSLPPALATPGRKPNDAPMQFLEK